MTMMLAPSKAVLAGEKDGKTGGTRPAAARRRPRQPPRLNAAHEPLRAEPDDSPSAAPPSRGVGPYDEANGSAD